VFSQGLDVAPESYARLLNSWAAAGYVVADPAYPYTSPNSPGGVVRSDIVHHPADLNFVITTLLNDRALSGLIESNEIAVIGQSDGGDVSLAAVANTCCRDTRVKAAVLLSGAEFSWFKGSYFSSAPVPLLVVQGTNDLSLNPVSCSVDLYNQAPQPKYYLSMIGQTHFSAYVQPGPALNVVTRVTITFLNGYLRNSTSALTAMTTASSVPGLATLTSQPSLPVVAGSCPDAPTG
jgi:predicted dienelactone hydrolase